MSAQGIAISRSETTPVISPERAPILVVESDASLGRELAEQLMADGHPTKLASTATHAGVSAGAYPPGLVVIGELDTPRGSLDLLESIRGHGLDEPHDQTDSPWPPRLPVIVLSARGHQLEVLRAFEAGTDDFLPRAAGYLELRARVRALLRRSAGDQRTALQLGPLTIDPASHAASLHGERLELRRMEYQLLLHLASEPRRVFTRSELLKAVWGYRSIGTTRTVDSHASRLRRKLGVAGERWIVNVWGVGYRVV
ncbi:MAG TPA: response regulator transcription factor [Solirubrobacteraceae bacterium]|nr:response regulator transcription factor [Solirubrobacteraceae bacterium]